MSAESLAPTPTVSTSPRVARDANLIAGIVGRDHPLRVGSLLPPELLHLTLSLARPSSIIATACSALQSICSTSHDVHIAWRNSLLLANVTADAGANYRLPVSDGIIPHPPRPPLENLLMAMLPKSPKKPTNPASAFTTTRPTSPDPIFTLKFLKYLYTRAFASPAGTSDCPYQWWRPDSHSLLLPVYLLRAGRLDLFELCLQLLIGAPWSAPHLALLRPCESWIRLCLDQRESTRHFFYIDFEMSVLNGEDLPYSHVLASFSLLEWSVHTVERIMRLFPTLTRDTVRQLAMANGRLIFDTMIEQLRSPSLPYVAETIVDMYNWLDPHAIQPLGDPLMLTIQHSGAPLEYMKRIMIDVDVAGLVRVPAEDRGVLEIVRTSKLLDSVMGCVQRYGYDELMDEVLDRIHVGTREWATWMPWNRQKCWELVQKRVGSVKEQQHIAVQGLHSCLLTIQRRRSHHREKIAPEVVALAKLLQDDFGIDLVDMMLENGGRHEYEHAYEEPHVRAVTLFSLLSGTDALPEPTKLLARVVTLLGTTISPRYPQLEQLRMPCVMATMLFHISASQNRTNPLDCIRDLSPSQLAILTVAVLLATSLADHDLNQFLPFNQQLSAVESLVAHAHQVCNNSSSISGASPLSLPSLSFYDRVTPSLRANLCDLIADMCWTFSSSSVALEDNDWDVYYNDFKYAKWVIAQLVSLDSHFVAAMAYDFEWTTRIAPDLLALMPVLDRAYAEAGYQIFELVAWKGGEVAIDGELESKDLLKMMSRWMMERAAYERNDPAEDEHWARRQTMLAVVNDQMVGVE